MSTPLYRIRDWEKHFEKAQGRKVGTVKWVAVPVKHEGLAFRRLMAREDGVAIFGAWNLLIQVAAKCRRGGALETDLGPLSATDLAIITGAPAKLFTKAIEVLSSPEISWLEAVTETGSGTGSVTPTPLPATGQDITEQDIDVASATSPPPPPKGGDGKPEPAPGRYRPEGVELPENLTTQKFRDAWVLWCRHRRERRQPLTPTAVKQQLANLARAGPDEAIRTIDHAITNGYQGLVFQDKKNGRTNEARNNAGAIYQPRSGPRKI